MPDDSVATHHPAPAPAQVQALLQHIDASQAFRPSRRHRTLLRHLVERTLAGDTAGLKESVIAVEVFGRPASRFDPRSDSIVRVETRRLRARLTRYFSDEGRDAHWQIELPVGSYVPALLPREPRHREQATRRARDLVERGEHFLRQPLSQATLEAALARFDAALRESPDHAPACVGLARAWLNLATGWYQPPALATEHAAEALRRALALAPGDAQAHALLGVVQHQFELDWPAARRSFERALALAPDAAFVHLAYGAHLVKHGQAAPAEQHLQRARELDPQYINTRVQMVNLRILQGRPDQAQLELDAMADIAGHSMPVAGMQGLLALLRGDTASALLHYQHCVDFAPEHPGAVASLAAALGAAGRVAEADALMAGLQQRLSSQLLSPYVQAIVQQRCGRPEAALALLNAAVDQRDPSAVMLQVDPSFDGLRGRPEWQALLKRLRPGSPG